MTADLDKHAIGQRDQLGILVLDHPREQRNGFQNARRISKDAPRLRTIRRQHRNRRNLTRREVRAVVTEDGKVYSD